MAKPSSSASAVFLPARLAPHLVYSRSLLPPLITDLSHLLLPSLPLLLTTLIRLTAPSPFHASNPRILQRTYDVLGALFRDLSREILVADGKEGGLAEVWEVVRRGLGAPARMEDAEGKEDVRMRDEEQPKEDEAESDAESSDEEEEETEPVASTSAQPIDTPAATGPKLHTSLPANFRTTPQTRRLLGNAFAFLVRKAKPTANPDEAGSLDALLRLMVGDVARVEELDGGERVNGGRGAKGRRKGKGKGRGQEEGSSNVLAEGLTWVVIESCSVRFIYPLCILSISC